MNKEIITKNVLYFLNTGKFYSEHKQLRDALTLFGPKTTSEELQKYVEDVSRSVNWCLTDSDYKKYMYGLPLPTKEERTVIAKEIIDYWSDGNLTKEIDALCGL